MFGSGSFFQFLNRTALLEGRKFLAAKLTANTTSGITQRQEAIQELSKMLDFRQEYEATARLLESNTKPASVVTWINSYQTFVPRVFSWMCYVQFGASLAIGILYGMDLISGWWLAGIFLVGLFISGRYAKKFLELRQYISELEDFFTQYGKLIEQLEGTDFQSDILLGLKKQILTDGKPASVRLRDFGRAIVRLDQGSNMLMGIFINAFALWNLKQMHTIEIWLNENKNFIAPWLDAVAQIDAMSSLGNFAYNHSNYIYPEIVDGDFQLKATDAVHPLLRC